jgi:hypothetical protein
LIKAPAVVEPVEEPVAAAEVQPVVPAASTSPAPAQMPYLIPALVIGFLALIGLALALRRTVSHPTT